MSFSERKKQGFRGGSDPGLSSESYGREKKNKKTGTPVGSATRRWVVLNRGASRAGLRETDPSPGEGKVVGCAGAREGTKGEGAGQGERPRSRGNAFAGDGVCGSGRLVRKRGRWGRFVGRREGSKRPRRRGGGGLEEGVPKFCLLPGQRRAKRSPRLRLPAAAEKSQNFFPLLQPARPSSRSSSPSSPQRRRRRRGRLVSDSVASGCSSAAPSCAQLPGRRPLAAGGSEPGGAPEGGVPPCPGPGPRCPADPRRVEGGGTVRGAKGGGGGGGDRLGRRGF